MTMVVIVSIDFCAQVLSGDIGATHTSIRNRVCSEYYEMLTT